MDLQIKVELWHLISASATGALWIVLLGQRVRQLEGDHKVLAALVTDQAQRHTILELKMVEELGKIQATLARIEAKMEAVEAMRG